MAKRIILGKPASEDHGLYVSKSGTDVVNSSNVLTSSTNLMFDSRVGVGALDLKYHGQGLLGVPGNNLATATNLNTVILLLQYHLLTKDLYLLLLYSVFTKRSGRWSSYKNVSSIC